MLVSPRRAVVASRALNGGMDCWEGVCRGIEVRIVQKEACIRTQRQSRE